MPKFEKKDLIVLLNNKIETYSKILDFVEKERMKVFSLITLCNQKINYMANILEILESDSSEFINISFSEYQKIAE